MVTEFPEFSEELNSVFYGTVRYRLVVVTVAKAIVLLERRRVSAKRNLVAVRKYALAMRENRWILNGMPIIISHRGVLLDGYQRLLACVEANMQFETFVAEDVGDDAYHTIDQQRRRSFANVLEARGILHPHALLAALVKLIRYDRLALGQPGEAMPSWEILDQILQANPQLEHVVRASFALQNCPLPEAVRSPLMCMGYEVDRDKTDRLIDALIRPQRYSSNEPGVLLRHKIENSEASGWSTTHLFALAIKALDATLRQLPLRKLDWTEFTNKGGKGEVFPRLTQYGGLTEAAITPTLKEIRKFPSGIFEASDTHETMAQSEPRVSFQIEEIDPDQARRYLRQNIGNRRLSNPHIEALARDLAQDRWMFNAQPICFARTGQLLNGQHRLHAVLLANRSLEVMVVRGLDEVAHSTYDNHSKRRAEVGDYTDSFGDQALAAAMANLLWQHERKTRSNRSAKATAAEVQQIIQEHPRLLVLRSFARRMGHFGRASVIGYAAYVLERDNASLAVQFLAALESGADLRPGHPILALRGTLQRLRVNKAPQSEQLAAILAGWGRFKLRQHIP